MACTFNREFPPHLAGLLAAAIAVILLLAPVPATAQDEPLVGPLRMTASPFGLVVADYVGQRVSVLGPVSLEVSDSFRIYTDESQLEYGKPLSVGWMNGRLYVGEEHTGLIQVWAFDNGKNNPKSKGKSKDAGWALVSSSLTALAVVQPSAIATDEALGLLFVASKGQQAVLVLDEAGNVLRTIGGPDSLGNPQAIALDRAGQRVFVSDDGIESCSMVGCSRVSAVRIYDYGGALLGTIDGDTGNAGFQFSRAQGVALDGSGRLYLADSYRHEVMIFDEASPNVFSAFGLLGGKGSGPGQLLLPTGVYVDAAVPSVYVANTMLARIEVFGPEDLLQ